MVFKRPDNWRDVMNCLLDIFSVVGLGVLVWFLFRMWAE